MPCLADCVRERSEPAAGTWGGAAQRDCDPPGRRGGPHTAHPPVADGKPVAGAGRRRSRIAARFLDQSTADVAPTAFPAPVLFQGGFAPRLPLPPLPPPPSHASGPRL